MTDQQLFFLMRKKKNQNIGILKSTDVCELERDISSGLVTTETRGSQSFDLSSNLESQHI